MLIDLDLNLIECNDNALLKDHESNNKTAISETLNKMNEIKKCIFDEAHDNMLKSQTRQKRGNDKRANLKYSITIGTKVLLRKHNRDDRKGGKLIKPWIGPYTVTSISSKSNCSLKNVNNVVLIKKFNLTSLYLYKQKIVNNDNIQQEVVTNFQTKMMSKVNLLSKMMNQESQMTLLNMESV